MRLYWLQTKHLEVNREPKVIVLQHVKRRRSFQSQITKVNALLLFKSICLTVERFGGHLPSAVIRLSVDVAHDLLFTDSGREMRRLSKRHVPPYSDCAFRSNEMYNCTCNDDTVKDSETRCLLQPVIKSLRVTANTRIINYSNRCSEFYTTSYEIL